MSVESAGREFFPMDIRRNSSPTASPEGFRGQSLETSVCAYAGTANNAMNAENSPIAR